MSSRVAPLRLAALLVSGLVLSPLPAVPGAVLDEDPYSIQILVDGVPLQKYSAREGTYVEALDGREYSIRLGNNTGERIAVALSVDGLNTIDAKRTSSRNASKWILGPYESITLDGWQTSSSTARRFFFTSEEDSYGAWLDETENLGIISAVVYREKRPRPAAIWKERDGAGRRLGASDEARPSAPSPEPGRQSAALESERADRYAATGIGQKVGHQVRQVHFDAEKDPAATLRIRYEFREALVRLGVLPRSLRPCDEPLSRRERARGFDGMEFAPDPHEPRCP